MAWPTLLVEIDFAHGPLTALASNTWTDVTAYVFEVTTARGRQNELARIEAGTATVTLDNSDRRFDPNNAAGPYYGTILPMRKIRISATYSASTYRLFTGFIESWPPLWPGGLDSTITIDCVDAFKFFANVKLNGGYSNEYTNWSINTWLTAIGWPAADRSLSSGQSQIQAGTFSNTPALQHFQNVADVESGLFFMSGAGIATFQDRHYRLTNSLTSLASFGDATAEDPWKYLTIAYDDTNIWNEARITRTGGAEQVAQDTASQALYFQRTYTKSLPLYSDGEALSLAQWIVVNYANPLSRWTTITLDGLMSDVLWPNMLSLVISNRILITGRPATSGAAYSIQQYCYIEGVAHHITDREWTTVFQVSPASSGATGGFFWILENATYGVLDSTTRLAY